MLEQKKDPETLMAAYEAGKEQLDAVLEGLTESQLDLSRAEGKWTIRQILHHIWDCETIWETIIKAALGNPGCTYDMRWYIRDNKCAVPLDYANRPVDDAVKLFNALRPYMANLIKHLPNAFERSISLVLNSDEYQEKQLSVGQMLDWQVMHLDIHLKQIRDTREVHGI